MLIIDITLKICASENCFWSNKILLVKLSLKKGHPLKRLSRKRFVTQRPFSLFSVFLECRTRQYLSSKLKTNHDSDFLDSVAIVTMRMFQSLYDRYLNFNLCMPLIKKNIQKNINC